jgi:hypothetical protein
MSLKDSRRGIRFTTGPGTLTADPWSHLSIIYSCRLVPKAADGQETPIQVYDGGLR